MIHKANRTTGWAGSVTLCLLLSFFGSTTSMAQEPLLTSEYSYRQFTSHDGLHHMLTSTVFQDKSGFLWIGTYKGFARFDGHTFTPFLSETMQFIHRIDDAENGEIYAFGDNNLFIVDNNDAIREVHLSDSLIFNSYTSQLLPSGYLVYESLNRERQYLMKLQKDSLTTCFRLPKLNNLKNPRIFWDKRTDLLYMPELRRVVVYNMKTEELFYIENMPSVENFCLHSRFGLLCIGDDGIYKIEHIKAEMLIPHSFKVRNKQMVETEEGGLLIRDFLTIYRLHENRIEELYHNGTIPLWDMTLDKENNLWAATSAGLFNFFQFNFTIHRIEGHAIQTIVQENEGTYWLGSLNDGLFTLSGGKLREVKVPFPKNWGWTSYSGKASNINNTLYFPRKEGVIICENKNIHFAQVPLNGIYNKVIPFGDDYLISSADALYFTNRYGHPTRVIDDVKQSDIYNLVVDKKGRIIASGEKGITIVTDTVHLIQQQNTRNSFILCMDKQGNIWSGSENRLNLLREDSLITVHSFKENIIVGLTAVGDHHLLIAMLKGFYIFDVRKYFENNSLSLLYYNHLNGMTCFEPVINAIYADRSGMIWMPTTDCIVSFDPLKLIRTVSPPILHIQSVETSIDNVQWEQANVDKNRFSYKINNFRFQFIGLKYSAVENVRYHYRLLGFQNHWSEPTKQRELTFNNLPPGNYIFEIYADAGTDDSRCETQSFTFTIKPAIWQTAWFLVSCIAFLMLGSAGIALYMQRRKNSVLLEKLRTEKEINELRISAIRLKAIPHFNANILSAIEYYIANRTKEEAMRILSIYSDFTYKTLSEVDKAARPLSEELAYVKMYLDLEKIRFMEKFDFTIEVEEGVDKCVLLPNMILHTYCENAVKHGLMPLKSGGLLTIHVSQHNRIVYVHVEDNGVGRKYAAQNQQLHSTKQGLSILNRQIEIYNRFNRHKIYQHIEDLTGSNGHPAGTRFMVGVPVDFAYMN